MPHSAVRLAEAALAAGALGWLVSFAWRAADAIRVLGRTGALPHQRQHAPTQHR